MFCALWAEKPGSAGAPLSGGGPSVPSSAGLVVRPLEVRVVAQGLLHGWARIGPGRHLVAWPQAPLSR